MSRWCDRVFRKDENDLVKKCMDYEVEAVRHRGRQKKTWSEVASKDRETRQLNKEDAVATVNRES